MSHARRDQAAAVAGVHAKGNAMSIIQKKTRRDFMRVGAGSLFSAAAFAALSAVAAPATQSGDAPMQTRRGERGRFKSVDEVLPQLEAPKVLEGFDASGTPKLRPAKRAITLRHLLTHTSGFTYSNWSDCIPQYEKATGMPDIAESRNGAFASPLEFDPGDRWQYGIGMDVVGKIIEAVSDESLEIYFREHIFEPLGMAKTGFLISSAQKRRTATIYFRQ